MTLVLSMFMVSKALYRCKEQNSSREEAYKPCPLDKGQLLINLYASVHRDYVKKWEAMAPRPPCSYTYALHTRYSSQSSNFKTYFMKYYDYKIFLISTLVCT